MVSLIPKTQPQEKILDITVKCNMEEKSSAIDTYSEKERKSGLKMVFHFCTRLEYRYSFGLNMILGSWERNSISNTE